MSTIKIAFVGTNSPDTYSQVWCQNAQELGYLSTINDISGLTKKDIVIYDKWVSKESAHTNALKVLFFPDVFCESELGYLNARKEILAATHELVDVMIVPPNPMLIEYAQKLYQKPVFGMMFGVYTTYFTFVRPKFPHKKEDLGYCWSPFSDRRDALARKMNAQKIQCNGQDMIDGMRSFRYMLNGHYTDILNNEQRLTEIPLAMSIPVSEELSDPEQLIDLHIVPVQNYRKDMYTLQEQKEIVRHNLRTVFEKYNSRTSLEQILSHVMSTSIYMSR